MVAWALVLAGGGRSISLVVGRAGDSCLARGGRFLVVPPVKGVIGLDYGNCPSCDRPVHGSRRVDFGDKVIAIADVVYLFLLGVGATVTVTVTVTVGDAHLARPYGACDVASLGRLGRQTPSVSGHDGGAAAYRDHHSRLLSDRDGYVCVCASSRVPSPSTAFLRTVSVSVHPSWL